jgi:hypothetical protein
MPTSDRAPPTGDDWVYLALTRCLRCGCELTIRRYEGDGSERPSFRDLTRCARCARR